MGKSQKHFKNGKQKAEASTYHQGPLGPGGTLHQSYQPSCSECQMELSALWPEAQADMSCGLITGHSDPRGRVQAPVRAAPRSQGRGQRPALDNHTPCSPSGLEVGTATGTTQPCLSPLSLAWLGSAEHENGVGLFSVRPQRHRAKEDHGKLRVPMGLLCRRGPS